MLSNDIGVFELCIHSDSDCKWSNTNWSADTSAAACQRSVNNAADAARPEDRAVLQCQTPPVSCDCQMKAYLGVMAGAHKDVDLACFSACLTFQGYQLPLEDCLGLSNMQPMQVQQAAVLPLSYSQSQLASQACRQSC